MDLLQHLAGHDYEFSHNESWSGPDPDPDPDPDKHALQNKKQSRLSRKGEKAKGTLFVLLEKFKIGKATRPRQFKI